jgi:hypothetical protein
MKSTHGRLILTVFGLLLAVAAVASGDDKPEISPAYSQFVRDQAAGRASALPDYSWAGYRFGASAIPDVAGRVFKVTDYGALPDDSIEDRDAIQTAIRAAEDAGGGIVYFSPGRFLVNEQPDRRDGIVIRKPGIILRGSGAGAGGTELFMRHYLLAGNPDQKWSVPAMFTFRLSPGVKVKRLSRITADAAKGSRRIEVQDAKQIQSGDMIRLTLRNPKATPEHLDGLEPWAKWTEIIEKGVLRGELHRVAAKEGNTITLGEPLHTRITAEHGWALESFAAVDGWAVEDLWFRGNFQEKFVHHKDFIHDAGWTFLHMATPRDAWVRRIRLTDVNSGIHLGGGFACSVLQIRFDGNSGHSTTAATGGYGVLMGLIEDASRTGMWHGPGVAGAQAGGVIWRYQGQARSGPDFHGSGPYATLLDASSCGLVGNGGDVKLLPNHLQDLTYWNLRELGKARVNYDFWDPQPAADNINYTGAKVVRPNLVGLHGIGSSFVREHVGIHESAGHAVAPASLYEAQLQLRLGKPPVWVDVAKAEWTRFQTAARQENPNP